MNCTSCGEENRESAKFCAECGSPITRACRSCDHPLSPTAKFCDECGTPVEPAAEPAAVPTDDGAVRRTVTIMFADLVGSTAFGESVDAETARREMGGYHELTRAVAEAHGGAVIKFIGDGVMVGFGVNEVAEDDADRAVRAGIELQRRFEEISAGVRARHGAEIGLRVGINTGEVVIAEDDADMVGDPINTAARIEAQCTPGRVLVGEQTWRLTRSTVDYEVLGEVDVKGKREPIATFQVLAAVEDEEVATPFVGREAELATLTAALENTIAEGAPQLVSVIGSPGVGKTRLAAELARRASEVTSFDLRVDRAGAATFEPVADLLRAVSEPPTGLSDEMTTKHLRTFVGEADDADRLVPLLAGFVGAAPMRSTEESFWAARRLVELVAATSPAVIVVDDIQWAEPLFLDLLEHLVEWTEGAAFVVALARPEIRDIRPAFAEVGRRVTEVIALEGLDAATMAELATGILGGKELPAELVARLPDSTEGNPLFVRELVRMLVDDEVIAETPSGWVLAIDADAVDVPPTIISLLASRVERMDDEERRVIEAASVVGSEFARGAVGTLLPSLGAAQLDRILERLRRQEIVDPTGSYWGDEPVWRFHHVLIRDAAYRRLLKERRIDMHRRVGQWTEATAAALGGEHEISIAFHYEQAHGYLRELGTDDGDAAELGGRAADLLALAAERALARDDLASAGSLATRALGVLDGSDPRRPELLLSACEAWFGAGRVRDGAPHLDELRRHTGDDRIAAWTAAFEGQHVVLTEPARLNEVEPIVADAAARLADVGDDAGVAKARLVRALILARTGRVGECEDELDAALAAARAADDRRRITAVLGAAPVAALWGPSPVARAGGRCLDIIRLLRITSASPMVEAVSIRCQAVLEAMRGRFDEARTLIGRSQAIVEELGLRHGILECRMFAGYVELLAGDNAAAEPHLRVAHAGLGTLGVGADAGQAAALLSRSLLAQGRTDEAAELADESARLAGQNLQTGIASRTARAEIAAHRGRVEDALRLADEAVAIGADTDLTMDHATALAGLARVQHLHGDHRGANDSTRVAAQLFADKGAAIGETQLEVAPDSVDAMAAVDDFENAASHVSRRFWSRLFDDLDVDAAMELVAGNLNDERALQLPDSARVVMRQLLEESLVGVSRVDYEFAPIALRGDRHIAARVWARYHPTEIEREIYTTARLEGGRLGDIHILENVDDAYANLERSYREHEGAEFAEVLDSVLAQCRALAELDVDATWDLAHRDCMVIDHRPLIRHETLLADMLDAQVETGMHGRMIVERFARLTEHGAVQIDHSDFRDKDGIPVEFRSCQLRVIRDGKCAHFEVFPEHDVEAACSRFDELTAARPVSNRAFEANREFLRRILDDRDLDAAPATQWFPVGAQPKRWSTTAVAVRGDRVALSEIVVEAAHERRFLLVSEIDESGLTIRDAQFEADDLRPALSLLNEWYIEGEGAPYREIIETGTDLAAAGRLPKEERIARLTEILHDDFTLVDHRAFSLPDIDRSALLEMEDAEETRTSISPAFLRLAPNALLTITEDRTANKTGGEVLHRHLAVQAQRGGRVTNLEFFAEDQLAEAEARFEELARADRRLRNLATDAADGFYARLARRELDGALAMLGADWSMRDNRDLALADLDRVTAESWFAQAIAEGARRWTTETIAIRGRCLAAMRIAAIGADAEWAYLLVIQADDEGRGHRAEIFDPDDLRTALDRLNEWYVEGEGARHRATIELGWALGKATELDSAAQPAALAELMHDDVQLEDHRPFSYPAVDLASLAAADVLDQVGVIVPEYLAIDDTGILIVQEEHRTNDAGGHVVNRHLTLMVRRNDKVSHFEWYGEDDRDAALARFHELTAPAPANAASRQLSSFWHAAYRQRDLDAAFALLRDDFVSTDHRRLVSSPTLDKAEVRDYLELFISSTNDEIDHEFEVIATRDDHLVLARIDPGDGRTGFGQEMLQLGEFGADGLAVRATSYSPKDRERALRDLEALGGLGPLENPASRLARSFYESVFDRGDMEPALRLVADDFAGEDRRPLIDVRLGKADLSANFAAIVDDATAWDWRLETIAIAGDRLALYRLSPAEEASSFSSPHLQVIETDGSRIIGGVSFEPDDFEGAAAEMHRRYRDGEGAEFATTLDRGWKVLRQFDDPVSNPAALADDFTSVDHRSMGLGTLDRDGCLDLLTDGREMAGHRWPLTLRIIAIDHGIVLREALIETDGLSWPALVLVVQRDGRICRQESFDVGDLDAALARFDELRPAGHGEEPLLRNAATDGLHAFYTKMYDDRDLEGAMTLVHDDFIGDDRRAVVSSVIGASDLAENFGGLLDHDGPVEWELEPIAVAGERLGLARHRTIRGSGFAVELLIIIEIDGDGLGTAVVAFDPHDLGDADAELTRRYIAGEGAPYATVATLAKAAGHARNDPEETRRLITDDFVLVDHRDVAFGDLDAATYLELVRSDAEVIGDRQLLTREILEINESMVLADSVLSSDASLWPMIMLMVRRGERLCRAEAWDSSDRDAALARFDELSSAPKRGDRASAVDARFRAAVRDRDMAALAELVTDDAALVDHRTLAPRPVDTIDGVVESVHAYTDQSMSHTFDLVAAYGEKVAFVEVTITADTGFDVQLYTVTEIDDGGRLCRFETFDAERFDAAQRRAAECWLDTEAPEARPAIEPLMDLSDAFGRNDFDAIAALLAPDFRHTVAKPLTADGAFDADGFIENMRVWVEMSGSIRNVTRAMVEWNRHGAVLISEIRATDPTGMVTEWASAHVLTVADGRITHWEEFETHAIDAAVARFDELTAEPPTPVNLVIQAFGEDTGFVTSGGFDPREAYSDAVIVDHRPGVVPLTSIDDLARSVAAFDEHDMDFRYEAVAWRGELVGLLRMTRSTASGMRSVWFNLIQADHDGRPARVEFFGEDHLDEALRRLDELWWENENPGIRPFGELLRSFGDRVDAGDWDGVRELLHPQFRHVVRKQLESEEYDTEGFVASSRIWKEMAGSAVSVSREIVRHDDTSLLMRQDLNATDEAGMETQWSALVIGIGENGLVKWWEELEPDDLGAAVARYEELTGTLGPASTK